MPPDSSSFSVSVVETQMPGSTVLLSDFAARTSSPGTISAPGPISDALSKPQLVIVSNSTLERTLLRPAYIRS
jgi:hypothetical protein